MMTNKSKAELLFIIEQRIRGSWARSMGKSPNAQYNLATWRWQRERARRILSMEWFPGRTSSGSANVEAQSLESLRVRAAETKNPATQAIYETLLEVQPDEIGR